ncbi:bifunctional pyr operon transcriptional regulator/uracil phosphoribosyltransferase PyrR [Peptoniphilus equinus]|uniref:Bifunctional protein PyrR n=1 Tax=Peptoniphilus equinus TaxID=3016343 RepID=A0ABY7QWA5_9FIRM|nr:bifunctional pyr operon transcriptional regulator/uracil phosphoribosyltransferase PyrR [Peptoniphilus equinus]WBW50711.1 bifunctional pyr operon transcriptional regulator/uracil phosphoribosyltransferase PyrR [Peptoniphilus equinus]
MKNIIMDELAMKRAIARISNEIIEKNKGSENLVLLGIVSRGEDLAHRIAAKIKDIEGTEIEVHAVNPTNFRDDNDHTREIDLSVNFDNKTVILVDDVLYTGRTVRAAMDAILSIGRPSAIRLVTLIDRGHRELPIRPDFVGKNLPTSSREHVVVDLVEVDGKDRVYIEA